MNGVSLSLSNGNQQGEELQATKVPFFSTVPHFFRGGQCTRVIDVLSTRCKLATVPDGASLVETAAASSVRDTGPPLFCSSQFQMETLFRCLSWPCGQSVADLRVWIFFWRGPVCFVVEGGRIVSLASVSTTCRSTSHDPEMKQVASHRASNSWV